tara:strand:+ start:791 stop:1927 length:1137 start_codon:yes stop_codon:yes gene_type:complete
MSKIKVNTITNVSGSGEVEFSLPLKIAEATGGGTDGVPSTISDGYGYIYMKADGKLYFDSDAIDEVELSGTGVSLGTSNNFTAAQSITGGADAIQLTVKGHSTQSTNTELFLVEKSDNSDLFSVDNSGNVRLKKDASVFSMGVGTGSPTVGDFKITHDNDIGATIEGSPVNITSLEASTWSTSSGALTISGKTGLNLQEDGDTVISIDDSQNVVINNISGKTVSIGHSTSETTVGDNLTVAGNLQVNGILDNTTLQSYKETICTTGAGISQSSNTITMDMDSGNVFYFVRTANCTTIAFTNMAAGQSATWISKNDGSSTFTNTFETISVNGSTLGSSNKLFPSGTIPVASTGTDEVDIFTFFWDGTNLYTMTGGLNFS